MKKRLLAMLLSGAFVLGCAGCAQEEQGLNIIDDKYRTNYEVFVYSFYDSDGDGVGDLPGLTQKLDYINDGNDETDADLGCNGIWLMPINPSTTYHKYDVTNYMDIDAEYGTLDDFKAFIAACDERGIRVTMDLIMNHSSSKHPWFLEAYTYIQNLPAGQEPDVNECPYVDYYFFSKESGSGKSPVAGTDWYYEANFWSEMPDLNLGNEAVRQEFEQIVDFWLALGVDGFRLDAAKEFYSGNIEKNIEVLTWFNEMVKSKNQDAYIVAEVWNDLPTYAQYYESGIDSCFNFEFADKDGAIANTLKRNGNYTAGSFGRRCQELQETLASHSDTYIDAPFYTNHDMGRTAGYYAGDESVYHTKLGHAMNLLMSGNAFLYYGEELGMKGAGIDENKRAPMYWSMNADAEGMCDGPATMEPIKMKFDSLEEQAADETSVYNYVKDVIKIRNTYPEIARGTVTYEEGLSGENVCTIRKTYGEEELLLIYNLSLEEGTLDLTQVSVGEKEGKKLKIKDFLLTGEVEPTLDKGVLTLPAYSVVVVK